MSTTLDLLESFFSAIFNLLYKAFRVLETQEQENIHFDAEDVMEETIDVLGLPRILVHTTLNKASLAQFAFTPFPYVNTHSLSQEQSLYR